MALLEFDREADGRWIAEFTPISGCMVYGRTRIGAALKALRLAVYVLLRR
jgi:hypothetical protein